MENRAQSRGRGRGRASREYPGHSEDFGMRGRGRGRGRGTPRDFVQMDADEGAGGDEIIRDGSRGHRGSRGRGSSRNFQSSESRRNIENEKVGAQRYQEPYNLKPVTEDKDLSATKTPLLPHSQLQIEAKSSKVQECSGGGEPVRGKRVFSEIVRSKPIECTSKCGTSGQKVIIQTNCFRLNKKPMWSISQYHVDFVPDIDVTRIRRAFVAQHKELLGGYVYNGTVLYTCTNLKERMTNNVLELTSKNKTGEKILLKIKFVGTVGCYDIEMLHLLNLILRNSMERLNLQQLGRNFFDPIAKIDLHQHNLELWPGYETSIRQHEHDILLSVDVAHRVLRTDSVYRLLTTCVQESKDFQSRFRQEIAGMVVVTDYNNKTYRVMDVDFERNPSSKFKSHDIEISFVEYYRKRYNIKIRDVKQPLLIAESTDRHMRSVFKDREELLLLIPELCRATGITDAMRNNFRLMKSISDETRLKPDLRIKRLITFNRRLKQCTESSSYLSSWQLCMDDSLVQAPGRILSNERIVFGNSKAYLCDKNADWTREFRNTSMFAHVNLDRWCVVSPSRCIRDVQNFVEMCRKVAKDMRMQIGSPHVFEMNDDRSSSYYHQLELAASKDPQLIMVVIPVKNEEKYACIKKKLCIDRPVPSQVICGRTISTRDGGRGLLSVATKVVIQLNSKILGAPWTVELPLSGLMTIGFDICHSTKDKGKSYGALVATMDIKRSTRFFSHVTEHIKGQELSNEIALSMSFALDSYVETHQALPDRILFYRDGVGDGQLGQVFHTEVKVLRERIADIYKQYNKSNPKFAFIVVSKRIITRLFTGHDNAPPGTVVDDIITQPERYDFFLVSQSVRQGTVTPTNYNILYDTMGLPADKLQILTYKMTHLYYNWTGTTRVPAVCQYAHKLASLIGMTLHRAPSNVLQNRLYFL